MKKKEASARIKINRLLEEAGWRFFDDENGPANIQLEPNVKMSKADLTGLGENFDKVKNGFADFLLLDDKGIFPKKYLQKCGIKESGMYNQIANYVYTQSEINIKVKDQAPKEYMAQVKEQCTGVNAVCGGIDSFFMATIVAAPVPNRWRWNAVRTY